ncbi:MAG: NADH-quinone oxidoreductase subunit A [Chloroflexota bacterium]
MALQEFAPIAALVILAVIVSLLVVSISWLFGPYKPTTRKRAPYESGMKPIGPANRRFPVKFYLIAVLFIIFDVEVIFFLPWAVILREIGPYGLIVMGVFTFILTIGFIYEWKKGALEWE